MPDPASTIAEQDRNAQVRGERGGQLAVYTCPECAGALWQIEEPGPVRFRCHVGHVLSGEALLHEQFDALERSLWRAVRLFADRANLMRQLAALARRRGEADAAADLEARAETAERRRQVLQQFIESDGDV